MAKACSWLLVFALLAPSEGWAAGALDRTFGTNGIVSSPIGGGFFAAASAPGDRIIAVGGVDNDPLLVRYLDDGSPDPTYGVAGAVRIAPAAAERWDLFGVVVQSDGSAVVTGERVEIVPPHFPLSIPVVARYDADGTPDTSFGTGGAIALTNDPSGRVNSHPRLQGDGKILVSGAGMNQARVWRLNTDGTLDSGFATGGVAILDDDGLANDLVVQPDDRIVVLINHYSVATNSSSVVVVRLDANGQLDPSFGVGGIAHLPLAVTDAVPAGLARQADGKLVIAGFTPAFGSSRQAFIARVDASGALDPAFGIGGLVVSPETVGDTFIDSVVIADDGRIIAGGQFVFDALLVAYDSGGALDTSFGVGGVVVSTSAFGANSLTLRPNSKLITAGSSLERWRLDDEPLCSASPLAACKVLSATGRSTLTMKDTATKDLLVWTWTKGSATSVAELGDPPTSTAYALCVYDSSPALAATLRAPGGGSCGGRPCWRAIGSRGFKRSDASGACDGVTSLQVQSGTDGRSKMKLRAKGPNVPTPPLPLVLPVRVQLQSSNGSCWEAMYATAKQIEGARFQAKSD